MDTESPPGRSSGTLMMVITWVIGMGLAYAWFDGFLERQYNPNADPVSVASGGAMEVRLQRNRGSSYVTGGQINGNPVTLLIDTGATQVAIPDHMAGELGMRRGAQVLVYTANGEVATYASRIDELRIGDIVFRDVEALLNPGMKRDEILLGMSALRHIDFSQQGDTLVLRHVNEG